jgi:bud site selection protein 20
MGRCPNHKNSHGKHYSHKTARRAKFLVKGDDLIHAELHKVDVPKTREPNSDLPGLGQFYCLHCDRYFNNASVRDDHYKTKKHKKRCVYASAPVLVFFIMGGELGIDV